MLYEFDANEGGIGDTIMSAYIARGLLDAGEDVRYYIDSKDGQPIRPDLVMLLEGLGFKCMRGRRGMRLGNHFPGYNYELRTRMSDVSEGRVSRLETWRDVLPTRVEPTHPGELKLPQDDLKWAHQTFAKHHGKGIVALFPLANFPIRTWPAFWWYELALGLMKMEYDVRAFLPPGYSKDENPTRPGLIEIPGTVYVGLELSRICACLNHCDLVVGNDSGGAHLAGLLKRPGLALCGPTVASFAHYETIDEVRVTPEEYACVGCHFDPEKTRPSCPRGCGALHLLRSDAVLERCKEKLDAA